MPIIPKRNVRRCIVPSETSRLAAGYGWLVSEFHGSDGGSLPRARRGDMHAPLPDHLYRRWMRYGQSRDGSTFFPVLVGLIVEDVRTDYCRMRLPWRTEITQPFGVAHGGAIATLIDSVIVPAIGSGYEDQVGFATIDFTVQLMGALLDEDAIAEGWVSQRGRSIAFCEAEVVGASSGDAIARGLLTYRIQGARK